MAKGQQHIMMKANFTIEQLIQKVRDLAEQNPDFVYCQIVKEKEKNFGCYYATSGNDPDKGCIFGQAILDLQPDLKDNLIKIDNNFSVPRIKELLEEFKVDFTQNQVRWCNAVQNQQDECKKWKIAVEIANRH